MAKKKATSKKKKGIRKGKKNTGVTRTKVRFSVKKTKKSSPKKRK